MARISPTNIYQPPMPDQIPGIDAFNVAVAGRSVNWHRFALVTSRVLLAFIFVFSGIMKFYNWDGSLSYMNTKNLPVPEFLLFMAAIIEIGAGLLLAFGRKVRASCLILFLYLIPTTLIFHNFWSFEGVEAQTQMINFLKNLSIMGGLLGFFVLSRPRIGDINGNHANL
jgi:putative oxidoreductase